jgi:hypothetical protein
MADTLGLLGGPGSMTIVIGFDQTVSDSMTVVIGKRYDGVHADKR